MNIIHEMLFTLGWTREERKMQDRTADKSNLAGDVWPAVDAQ